MTYNISIMTTAVACDCSLAFYPVSQRLHCVGAEVMTDYDCYVVRSVDITVDGRTITISCQPYEPPVLSGGTWDDLFPDSRWPLDDLRELLGDAYDVLTSDDTSPIDTRLAALQRACMADYARDNGLGCYVDKPSPYVGDWAVYMASRPEDGWVPVDAAEAAELVYPAVESAYNGLPLRVAV